MNQGEVTVTLESVDHKYTYDQLGIDTDASDQQVIEALTPVILEQEGIDISTAYRNGAYTVKRTTNGETGSENIYVFPKSTAGV